MPVKVNGQTSGSVTVAAPATGSDVTLTLPGSTMDLGTELASKLPIAGGKILQIVRATDATQRSTSSTTFVDAGNSITITPQKSDSAIIVIATCRVQNSNNSYTILIITDNSNNALSGASNCYYGDGSSTALNDQATLIGYSTPATTSATTYKLRFSVLAGSGATTLFNNDVAGQLYAIEVSA